MSVNTSLTAVADSIRAKTGTTDKMKIEEMPALIDAIESGGLEGAVAVTLDAIDIVSGQYEDGVGLTGIKTIILPNVETISTRAFMNATEIETVDIGENVTNIHSLAFDGCSSLTKVIFRGLFLNEENSTKIQFLSTPVFNNEGYIYVPDEYLEQYKTATNWVDWASQIKPISEIEWLESVESITVGLTTTPTSYLEGLKNIKEIKLPNVERILNRFIYDSDVEILDIGPSLNKNTGLQINALVRAPKLKTVIFRGLYLGAFYPAESPLYNGEGYIYVPDEYVEQVKASDRFSRYVNQIKPLSDIEPINPDALCIKSTAISFRTLAGEICVTPPNDGIAIKKVVLPNVTYFDGNIFDATSNVEVLDIGSSETNITLLGSTFAQNPVLATLIFRGWIDTPAGASEELKNTPILEGNGYLYVPDDLLEQYKTSTAWSSIASQIKPISEL